MNSTEEILRKLVACPAVSGFEKELGISTTISSFFKEAIVDDLGNVIVTFGSGNKKVLVEAHLDEVGFIRTTEGFVFVGSIDPTLRTMPGIVAAKQPGSPGYFPRFFEKEGEIVRSPALDNKVGCAALILLAKELEVNGITLYLAFTVQEETGKRGIMAVVESVRPDILISVDSAYAQPYAKEGWQIPQCGKGPAVQLQGRNFCTQEPQRILQLAKNNNIPCQLELVDSSEGGTNLSASLLCNWIIQLNIPVRFQHKPISEADMRDIISTVDLLRCMIKDFGRTA